MVAVVDLDAQDQFALFVVVVVVGVASVDAAHLVDVESADGSPLRYWGCIDTGPKVSGGANHDQGLR